MIKKIVTHNGDFHSDDVFSIASISIKLGEIDIVRTRDNELIKNADYAIDVGGESDGEKKFDHHQEGGAGERINGIPYASFGLVWKAFGEEICGGKEISELIDKKLVQPIDAADNGLNILTPVFKDLFPYMVGDCIQSFKPGWNEENLSNAFKEAVEFAKNLLLREISKFKTEEDGKKIVEDIYKNSDDKQIIIMDKKYPWENVLNKYNEPLFAVYPTREGDSWHVKSIRSNFYDFKVRKEMPISWAGKRDKELAELTGIDDALFCHNKRFLVAARTKEGAIKLAHLALMAN